MSIQLGSLGTAFILVLLFGATLGAQVVPQDLYYKLNEGAGTTTANSASPGQGSSAASFNGTWLTPGQLGTAAGTFVSTSAPFDTGWSFSHGTSQSWTIELWMNKNNVTSGNKYAFGYGTADFNGMRGWWNANDFQILGLGGSNIVTTGGVVPAGGGWVHVAMVYDATVPESRVYVNGTLNNTISGTQTMTAAPFCIGGRALNDTNFFEGDLDEFRMWNVARSQAEIQSAMNTELNLSGFALVGGSPAGLITGSQTDLPILDFSALSNGAAASIDSITFSKNGTIADNEITSVDLYGDTNDNGVVDTGEPSLGTGVFASGSITFGGSPLVNVPDGTPVPLLLVCTVTNPPAPGTTLGAEIASGTAVSFTGGTDNTSYPLGGSVYTFQGPATSYPFFLGFETPEPYFNGTFTNSAGDYPTVVTVGGTPGLDALTSTANSYSITGGPVGANNSTPHTGNSMLHMSGGSSSGAVALDLAFDMSTFSTTDYVELEFWWNDEGLDSSTTTNDRQGVFLSTDGGTTWEAALYQFDVLGQEGVWNHVNMNISPILAGLSLAYTNQVVIRFQMSESSSADNLLIDDIRIDNPVPQLRIRPAPPTANLASQGTDQLVAEIETGSLNSTQSLSDITLTQIGSINNTALTNLKLWEDTNLDDVFSAGDAQLGSTVAAMTGSTVTFSSALLRSYTLNESINLFVTADIAGTISLPNNLQFSVAATGNVTTTPGIVGGNYPVEFEAFTIQGPATSYPFFLGFETPEPYFNGTFTNALQQIPTVITVGGTPGSTTTTSTANTYAITGGPVSGSNPHSGSFMLDMIGGSSSGVIALDLDFDMSTFTLADFVEFEFWWNDEGLDVSATTDPYQGVFLSTNGGTTWEAALYQFDAGGPEGVWNQVKMNLTPILSALSLNYTSQVVIRFQMSDTITSDHLLIDDIFLDKPVAQLRVESTFSLVDAAFSAGTDQVVAEISTFSVNSVQALDSIALTQNGTANNADLTNLKLWEDTNNDGVLNTGDTQLGTTVAAMSGAIVTFSATPLRSYTLNETKTLFVTADIAAAPTTPAMVQFRVASSSDVMATPGISGGSYPVDFGGVAIKVPASTFPYVQDFETVLPYDNILFTTNGTSVPTVAAIGLPSGPPASYSLPGGFQVSSSTAGSPPNAGTGMIELSGQTNIGYIAMDLLFDMSAFDVATDTFDLEFFWNDEGIDNSGDTNEALGVFISTDGGATWGIALYQFPHSLNLGIWNQVNMNLSAMLAAAGMNYTNQVVLRFQYAEDGTTDYLLIDDITLSHATTAELRVTTGPAGRPMAVVPGDTDVVMGSFRFDAIASTQTVSGITISNSGSLADSELTNVRLYEDTNNDNVFNAGDSQLGTSGTFSGGDVIFAATTLTQINGTAPTLFVVVDVAATAPASDTLACSIDGGVLAINTTPGPVNAAASVSGGSALAVLQPAATPALQDFETLPPYASALLTNETVFPTVTTVGGVPGVASLESIGFGTVTAGPVNGSSPFAGTQMLDLSGATGTGGSAINLFYDMSAFTTTDIVQLQFAWNDEGLDSDTTTVFNERFMGVFLSTDAGATWEAVVFQFNPGGTEGVWNQESINLSAIMTGLSLSYTDRMALRFQMAETATSESLLLDDISVEVSQDIDVLRNTISIPNASFEVVGPIPVGTNQTFTLDIANAAPNGANDLNLTGTPAVQIGAVTNANANISAQPTQVTLSAGASESFDIDISPITSGAYVVELIIANDDPDESPYIVTLVGTGVEPEIDVQRPAGTSIPDGGTDAYGSIAAGVSNIFTYFIVNGGNATLNLTGTPVVAIQNIVNANVNVVAQPTNTALAPAAVAPFDLDVTPNLGAFSFEIVVQNNDANEGNYTITVSGSGATTPEIDVKDSVGTDVFEGGVFTLGNIAPGNTQALTLTIENNGNADLLLVGTPTIEILSQNNVTATVTASPATTIAVGNSETFTVDISPSGAGSFSFQVRIQNNDANENNYTFTVSGFSSNPVSGGGGSGGGDGGGCSTGSTDLGLWSLLLGALALMAVVTRVRASRD